MGRGVVCCCPSARVGVIITSLIWLLLSGFLSGVCWFEVSRRDALTSNKHASFMGVAIVETLHFLISFVGFIGAVVRKLTLATTYIVGLCIHFLISLIVGIYLFVAISHVRDSNVVAVKIGIGCFIVILIVQFCFAIVAGCYFYKEKRAQKYLQLDSSSTTLLHPREDGLPPGHGHKDLHSPGIRKRSSGRKS